MEEGRPLIPRCREPIPLTTPGAQIVYSKYAGTELEFSGANHIILKEDDVVGILQTDDVKDLQPLNDRVLIKVVPAEEKTAGGLLLTEAAKEKPSIGTVIAVGPGPLDEEGNRKPLTISPGSTVLYSKYAGNEFKGAEGSDYIALEHPMSWPFSLDAPFRPHFARSSRKTMMAVVVVAAMVMALASLPKTEATSMYCRCFLQGCYVPGSTTFTKEACAIACDNYCRDNHYYRMPKNDPYCGVH
ncbi:hypothetical protein KSP40_PGU013915 [Platanthera guangdongensis]|uniref:Uncharacterized protein n=1 Tax=Platanthera guangdongensis TaxID=2320717 RepID=A0ABR2N5G0_9ASPA